MLYHLMMNKYYQFILCVLEWRRIFWGHRLEKQCKFVSWPSYILGDTSKNKQHIFYWGPNHVAWKSFRNIIWKRRKSALRKNKVTCVKCKLCRAVDHKKSQESVKTFCQVSASLRYMEMIFGICNLGPIQLYCSAIVSYITLHVLVRNMETVLSNAKNRWRFSSESVRSRGRAEHIPAKNNGL